MGVSFDKIDGVIWYDGKLVPWADAKVHVLTHGLHYASAVFEGERAYGGGIFKLREHTDPLVASGAVPDMVRPYPLPGAQESARADLPQETIRARHHESRA